MEPKICPNCGENLVTVASRYTSDTYLIIRGGVVIEEIECKPEFSEYCCPKCFEPIPRELAEEFLKR